MYVSAAGAPMTTRLGSGGATSTSIRKCLWASVAVVRTQNIILFNNRQEAVDQVIVDPVVAIAVARVVPTA
jgi:hypothetical protein